MKEKKKSHSKTILIALLCLAILIAAATILFKLSKSRDFQFFGEMVTSVETSQKRIALTFDDGPTESTQAILDLLKKCDVKATFFLCGNDIEKRPDDAKAIVDSGHQIGNHSYSHRRMVLVSYAFCKEEIEKTNALIRGIGYTGKIYFRPPYFKRLFMLPLYLSKHDITTVLCSIEPETDLGSDVGSDEMADYVIKNATKGAIILMHPMYNAEVVLPAAEKVITELKKEGYTFCTVDELISSQNE